MITGAPEFMFQHRAIVAGFHIAASGVLDKFRILEQVPEGYRVVASRPVNADQPEKSGRGVQRLIKHSPNGNAYGDSLAFRLVQDGQHWIFDLVLRHSSHLCPSLMALAVMLARIPASTSV